MDRIQKLMACALLTVIVGACSTDATTIESSPESVVPDASGERVDLAVEFVESQLHSFSQSERTEIRAIAEATVREVRPLVDGEPSTIRLTVRAGTAVIPETGEAGVALGPGLIGWTVDPTRPGGAVAVAKARLRSTLFHEVHHLVRGWTVEGGTAGRRLIDAAVAEGLATAFERDAASSTPPWGEYPRDVRLWSEQLIALPVSASYGEWMFQHRDGRRWIGYRAGTFLADRASAGSGRSPAELASVPTDEILGFAGCSLVPPRCEP